MDLTDAQWEILKPLFQPKRRPDGRGRPWRDARAVLNGVLWVLRTGAGAGFHFIKLRQIQVQHDVVAPNAENGLLDSLNRNQCVFNCHTPDPFRFARICSSSLGNRSANRWDSFYRSSQKISEQGSHERRQGGIKSPIPSQKRSHDYCQCKHSRLKANPQLLVF